MHIQKSNFGTNGTFGYQVHNERYDFCPHIHQFAELTLMLDGEMDVTVGGNTETLRRGQFALVFPFHVHSYHSERVNNFIIYTFSPSVISDFMKSASGKTGSKIVFNASPSTLSMFNERLISEDDLSLYSIRACLYSMVSDFTNQAELIRASSENNMLSKILTYLNEHFSESLSLDDVARSIGYSANYLSHCIKKSFDLNFCALLGCIRTEQAKYLLTESDKSVLEIALECGFGSERSFHRQFKSITGKTPHEYRTERQLRVIKRTNLNTSLVTK